MPRSQMVTQHFPCLCARERARACVRACQQQRESDRQELCELHHQFPVVSSEQLGRLETTDLRRSRGRSCRWTFFFPLRLIAATRNHCRKLRRRERRDHRENEMKELCGVPHLSTCHRHSGPTPSFLVFHFAFLYFPPFWVIATLFVCAAQLLLSC